MCKKIVTFAFSNSRRHMKQLVSFILLIMIGFAASAQEYIVPEETLYIMEVQGSNYHGFSFNKDWEVDFYVENQDGRYTPTNDDIVKAEALIQKRIAYLNREHENQEGRCPIIDEHIRKYERQYVGFTDVFGHHIVWVNFLWDESLGEKLSKDVVLTEGSCGRYWRVKVNVDTEKVYGLEVNGSGDVKYIPRVVKPGPRISKPRKPGKMPRVRKTGIKPNPEEITF